MVERHRRPGWLKLSKYAAESRRWLELYGSYGVLGHGEDVFTAEGARFRRHHRGR